MRLRASRYRDALLALALLLAAPAAAQRLDLPNWPLQPAGNSIVYLATGGTGTGRACLNQATPCGTLANAVGAAAQLANTGGSRFFTEISVLDAGPFAGGGLTWNPVQAYAGTGSIEFPYLYIHGSAGTPAQFIPPASTQPVFVVQGHSNIVFQYVTMTQTTAARAGLAVSSFSTVKLSDSTIQASGVTGTIALWAFDYGMISLSGAITLDGGWSAAAGSQNDGLVIDSAAITCGAGFSYSQAFFLLNHGFLDTGDSGISFTNCPSTGTAVQANGGAQWKIPTSGAGRDLAVGNGLRLASPDAAMPTPFAPTLSACTNGTLYSSSTNYAWRVDFSGANTTCTLTWGKPTGYLHYFRLKPQIGVAGSKAVLVPSTDNDSMTFTGSFASGDFVTGVVLPTGSD